MNYIFVPIVFFIICSFYIYSSLKIAWKRIGIQKEPSTAHSDRAYKAFEFFFTVTTAIVAGIGYVRITSTQANSQLMREAMVLLAWLQYSVTFFMIIAATSHLGSKWERWQEEDTKYTIKFTWWRMVEPWMIILAFVIGTSIWITAQTW